MSISRAMAGVLSLLLLQVIGGLAIEQTYCSSQNTGGGSPTNAQYQSTGLCHDQCYNSGSWAFAVLQGSNCWCSNYIPAQQQSISNCNQGCPGTNLEDCGGSNLFGYIAIEGRKAAGTATAGGSQTSQTFPRPGRTFSQNPSPSPSSSIIETSGASTAESSTSSSPSLAPSSTTSSQTVTSSSSSSSDSTADVTSPTTRVVTVSGAIVTQTVTSAPRTQSTSNAANEQPQRKDNNTGVIVGAVIGSVFGLIFIALLIFCFMRRKGPNGKRNLVPAALKRDASVLSRSGLMASAPAGEKERSIEENRYGSQRHSQLYNDPEDGAISAAGGSQDGHAPLARRNSRPLVYDQRLNPAALMENWQQNGSRTSIGTLQDQRDYSRPLGVTNPDP